MNPGASRRCFATHLSMTELHSHGHGTRSLDRDIQIHLLCTPANPAFTISKMMTCARIWARAHGQNTDIPSRTFAYVWLACRAEDHGAIPSSPNGLRRGSLRSFAA